MLLAVDIGNTNIVAGIFDGDKILVQWRIATDARRTGDEYTSIILTLARDAEIDLKQLDSAVISSVVPALTGPFVVVGQHICKCKPFVVESNLAYSPKLPVNLPKGSTHVLGTDLLSNAVSAWHYFKGEANIVVDFGTALTLTATDSKGIIQGITISPGLGTAIKALAANTAQLPLVPLVAPPSSLGSSTTEAIQSGVVLGYKGLVEYLVGEVKKDMEAKTGDKNIHVIATGGLNSVLKPITSSFTIVEKDLTLKGLKLIFDICNK